MLVDIWVAFGVTWGDFHVIVGGIWAWVSTQLYQNPHSAIPAAVFFLRRLSCLGVLRLLERDFLLRPPPVRLSERVMPIQSSPLLTWALGALGFTCSGRSCSVLP